MCDILCKCIFDDFQNLLLSYEWDVCFEEWPKELTEVLVKQIGISDGMFDVEN
jgi:hypothetical protein